MSERSWTEAQRAAFTEKGRTLLVSAAAGSGKTSVLTERVIRAITDPEQPIDLMRILAVTFTRSAAADLRDKLGAALRRAMSADPGNGRLRRQYSCLSAAHICTIDSFCLDVVRRYGATVGLPRAFRLADGAESLLLCTTVMDELIDDLYDGCADDCLLEGAPLSAEDFSSVADLLTSSKKEVTLGGVLLSVWESCSGYPEGVARATRLLDRVIRADSPLEGEGGYRETAIEELSEFFEHHIHVFSDYIPHFASYEPLSNKYLEAAEYLADYCREALEIIGSERPQRVAEHMRGYTLIRASVKAELLTPDSAELLEGFKSDRKQFKERLDKFLLRYFVYTEEELAQLGVGLGRALGVTEAVLKCYDARLRRERQSRGVLSFGDIEFLALRLLEGEGEDGRSAAAAELASEFDLVFVDEYQDVNPVQHRIFEKLSRGDNLFTVGDVKQSIYSFRGAAPEVFTSLRRSYLPFSPGMEPGVPAAIDMSSNFRSDPGVINFVNTVFDRAFGLFRHRSGYDPDRDRLIYGKKPEKSLEESAKTVVAVFSKTADDEEDESADPEETAEVAETADGDGEQAEVMSELDFVLSEMARLIREEGYAPGDFALILRGNRQAAAFAEGLRAAGYPVDASAEEDFFSAPEVLLALCLFNAVDNPRRDIYLAGLMMSPIGGFSADELAVISRESGTSGGVLIESLRAYCAAHPDYERGADFLERLERFRSVSEGLSADRLVTRLYEETGIMARIKGEAARLRLERLAELARSLEGSSYQGLSAFIAYLNRLSEKGELPGGSEGLPLQGSVRIITAHSSKGLEFPVCFVCGCEAPYNFRSLNNNLIFEGELGAIFRLRSEDGFSFVDNPWRNIACDRIRRRQREEELRLLYVALTRAVERLYVCATPPKGRRTDEAVALLACGRVPERPMTPYMLFSAKSFFDSMMAVLPYATEEERASFRLLDLRGASAAEGEAAMAEGASASEPCPPTVYTPEEEERIAALTEKFGRRFDFVYPGEVLTRLPKKLPVSALREDLLDTETAVPLYEESLEVTPEADEADSAEGEVEPRPYHLPRFMGGAEEGEAAARGIATHLFMQFCRLRRLQELGVEAELGRLLDEGYLSAADAERVRVRELEAFRRSRLLHRMMAARQIRRELRFNLELPAADFTRDAVTARALEGRSLLVQGVIDCVFETAEGELVLVDYKTDRPSSRDMSREQVAAELRRKHARQLGYYALAVSRMFGRPPDRVMLYSLYLGEEIKM